MERRKTTVYLDADVLTATKVLAATGGRSESRVIEDALRAYLRGGQLARARTELIELIDRIATRDDLPDDAEALALAVEEVRAVRSARRPKSA